jgi:hypothetical protein
MKVITPFSGICRGKKDARAEYPSSIYGLCDQNKGLMAGCHSFGLFFVFYDIHTFI